jgi:hypothetical protein
MKSLPKDAVYLGSSLTLSRSRTKYFKYLQNKIEAKLLGWRSKCLSWVGRGTMIKYVVQAIPTYTMSTFEVPLSIYDKIDSATRRFWWNPSSLRERYLAWKA